MFKSVDRLSISKIKIKKQTDKTMIIKAERNV